MGADDLADHRPSGRRAQLRRALVGVYGPALVFSVGTRRRRPGGRAARGGPRGRPRARGPRRRAARRRPDRRGRPGRRAGGADRRAPVDARRVGARRSAAFVACALAPALWVLAAGITTAGAAASVFGLARQAYLTEVTPVHARARALSTLGGVSRIGAFVGPFLGAAVVHLTDLRGGLRRRGAHQRARGAGRRRRAGRPRHRLRPPPRRGTPVPLRTGRARPRTRLRDARPRGAGRRGGPRRPSGRAAAVDRAPGAQPGDDEPRLRGLGRGRHAALLPGRPGHGPARPAVGRHPVDGRPRAWRSWRCRGRRRSPASRSSRWSWAWATGSARASS